ncbi:glutamate--cysteine ligase regulatory subunit-like [Paramacrobiotus metropolitanus]|uniref:glutamate--cysteine ligase regulatory subunit-like n=1 Tax=Paramacrobiotus metropolitanus TaxID=2943436 RepID=UPI002445ED2C|nr:glutamate--cysteine ligase regulatory subunit-like [Paramacrobiotus metropolitanus]XP_055352362.1 glutamate--cysteine ligase regulatory subunit-like [Paramacrobiotus metropolitanus]XP_055352370.1 glutamate--cysteine ligase regulatory subunit-like [Paramacrobiotus metropolitanus]XP_055352377.1 glutamate--cysteine ligase regulatory subunit-like [Paramacrobiotus metropolitanus]
MDGPTMNHEEIVVHTGNVLHSEHLKKRVNLGPQEELIDCLLEALKSSAPVLQGSSAEGRALHCGDGSAELFIDEKREDLKITVKIFLIEVTREAVKNAVSSSLKYLQVESVDLLLVSVPSNNYTDFREAWLALEEVVKSGAAESIGVSDFSLAELEKLYGEASVKPSVNQVNLESCCVIPPELSEFAKKHQIQLLTHNDPRVMMDCSGVSDLLKSSTPFLKCDDWKASWLVRYTAMVKLRGVVKSRGFIFCIRRC